MRTGSVVIAATAALAAAAVALASPTKHDPNKLILGRNAFPAHSDYDGSPGAAANGEALAAPTANPDPSAQHRPPTTAFGR